MIVDCFSFNDEFELLEIRLAELKNTVDCFVLIEASQTLGGKPKPFLFEENRARFSNYDVFHIKIHDFPAACSTPRQRREYMRHSLGLGIQKLLLGPLDIILLSNVDEIPDPIKVRQYAQHIVRGDLECCQLEQTMYFYALNLRANQVWNGTRMVNAETFRRSQDNQVRPGLVVPEAGWHFRYFGGAERIHAKLAMYRSSDTEPAAYPDLAQIQRCIAEGQDLFGREICLHAVLVDDSFPHAIQASQDAFARWIRPVTAPATPLPSPFQTQNIRRLHAMATTELLVRTTNRPFKVNLGSRREANLGDDWIYVAPNAPMADIRAPFGKLPFETETVEEIFSAHALETVPMAQITATLQEWHRVVRPGGRLTVRVLDFPWCLIQWLANPTTGRELVRILGSQTNADEFTRSGFIPSVLSSALSSSGWTLLKLDTLRNQEEQILQAEAIRSTARP